MPDRRKRGTAKMFDQIERAGGEDTQETDKLYRRMNVYGLPKADANSQDAQCINATFTALDKVCTE